MVLRRVRKNEDVPTGWITFFFFIALAGILLAGGCVSQLQTIVAPANVNNSEILLEFPGSTTILAQGITSVADLRAAGVRDPEQQSFTEYLKKFDLVTFNQTALNNQIKTRKGLPVRIRGKEYTINITKTRPDKVFSTLIIGDLEGEKISRVFLRISKEQTDGSVVLNNETIRIIRYSNVNLPFFRSVPSYYIYSSEDVYFDPKLGLLCGGGFEVYKIPQNQAHEEDVIHLSEGDFVAVPEFRPILLGERREGCIWDTLRDLEANGTMLDENQSVEQRENDNRCIGSGRYDCQGGILGYYRYFEYEGKYYHIMWTSQS